MKQIARLFRIVVRWATFASLTLQLSGCFDFDFPDFSGFSSVGSFGGGGYYLEVPDNYDGTISPRLWIDSVSSITSSTAILYMTIAYDEDSTLVLNSTALNSIFEESNVEYAYLNRRVETGPDTIDFSQTKVHSFHVELDSLYPNRQYAISATRYLTINGHADSTNCRGCIDFFWTKKD